VPAEVQELIQDVLMALSSQSRRSRKTLRRRAMAPSAIADRDGLTGQHWIASEKENR
jgi:hypothetical protein